MQQSQCLSRDQRRLFGGFGDDTIAGHQGGGDLPGKNRQRKIPRRNRYEHAAAAQRQYVALARRPRHGFARAEQLFAFGGVVAAEIGRLADFRKRIIERLAAFALQQRDDMRMPLLQHISSPFQDSSAYLGGVSPPSAYSLAPAAADLV